MSWVRPTDSHRTTLFRLSLLYGLLYSLGTALLLYEVYHYVGRYQEKQADLVTRSNFINIEAQPAPERAALIAQEMMRDRRHINLFGLYDATGHLLAGNLEPLATTLPVQSDDRQPHDVTMAQTAPQPHILYARLLRGRLSDGTLLVTGRNTAAIRELRNVIRLAMLSAAGAILIITLTGMVLSIRPIRRIDSMRQISRDISRGHIDLRLPVSGRRDELDMLAGIINGTLDDMQRLLLDIKSATDHIAHDLRMPLTRLRALLNRARQSEDANSANDLLNSALQETDALMQRFNALLRIAEISSGMRRSGFTDCDLVPMLDALIELYSPLAEEQGINLHGHHAPDQAIIIHGDPQLLFEALSNLLDNAIKFSPAGHIDLFLRQSMDCVELGILDRGPGLREADIGIAVTPFFRADNSGQPGHGLGLSIVKAITDLHGASLHLENRPSPGGLAVTLRFPVG